ncbi:MAG: hypothetical protein ACHQQS_08850 [Thermoanaerobaculales bacterium]
MSLISELSQPGQVMLWPPIRAQPPLALTQIPGCRQTSLTATPLSTCLNVAMICSSLRPRLGILTPFRASPGDHEKPDR